MNAAKGHVLITGAAIRVGRVIALTLAKAGWDIAIHCNASYDDAHTLATEITAIGRQACVLQANLEKADEVNLLIQRMKDLPLTALVNNASLFTHDSEDPDGTRHLMINYEAPRLLAQALYNQLPAGAEGSVVHILDKTPIAPTMKHYGESRAKLRGEIHLQAKKYAPQLRINAIEPGPTLINSTQSPAFFEKLVGQTALQRASSPEDIAHATLFLLENRSMTGEILVVDAGMHLLTS
jgi:NAD(P)-dependent dehydrogenase (short-subunit alcohol dehydrogenase family)